jgi:transcriptional regulator with XRE-family HTH domain
MNRPVEQTLLDKLQQLPPERLAKRRNGAPLGFGARLVELRKAAGYTQTELANELGVTRRMIAYYEGETEHPPANLLPGLAQALGVKIEALLGSEPLKKSGQGRKPVNSRLQRRLQQIEKLEPAEKRQMMQVIDTLLEHAQLKRKVAAKQAA